MIRRWLRGCVLPSALCLAAVGCTPSVESLTGGLVAGWAPGAKAADDAPPARAPDDFTPDEQVRLCLDTGRQLDKVGNDEGALEQYEHVLALDPSNLSAMRRLCVLYDRQARWDKAEEFYKKVSRARPKDADLWSDWGYSYYLRAGDKNWAEAEDRLRQALKIDPQHARAHSNLGLVLGHLKRYPESLQEFKAAGLSEAEARCNLAFIYWTQNKLDEAKQECRKARDMDSSCLKARDMLAALEQPPHRHEDDRTAGPRDGKPRASKLTAAQWEAEHEAARRAVAGHPGAALPAEDKGAAEWQSSGPIVLPSGAGWMPVKPAAPTPAPAPGGSPGTITLGGE